MKRLLLMLAMLASAAYVGCKQTSGERCQVDDDCESGVCNQANGICNAANDMSGDIDALVIPVDALPPPDTLPPIDAPAAQ